MMILGFTVPLALAFLRHVRPLVANESLLLDVVRHRCYDING